MADGVFEPQHRGQQLDGQVRRDLIRQEQCRDLVLGGPHLPDVVLTPAGHTERRRRG
jgi:hypothetical protein